MRFEWDDEKAIGNVEKHGITFGEATEVFYDPNALEGHDPEHSDDEDRFVIIGYSASRLLFVVFAQCLGKMIRTSRRVNRRRRREIYMKKVEDKEIETKADEIVLEVTQQDYEDGLKRGWTDDDMLKPGRYKMKRGGFLARHPELKIKEKKHA